MNIQPITTNPSRIYYLQSKAVNHPQFRATHSNTSSDKLPEEAEFLKQLREGKQFDITATDNTGNSMFHSFVKANYVRLVSYILANRNDSVSIVNTPNKEGKYPYDIAVSNEMRIQLNHFGATKAANINSSEPVQNAQVVAAKMYMTQPVPEIVATALTQVSDQVSEQPQTDTKNYFGSIEEVSDESTKTQVVGSTTMQNAGEEPKAIKPKALNVEGLNDFKLLEITEADILSLEDLIGQAKVKEELIANVIAPLKDTELSNKLKENNVNLPNGILIQGQGGEITVVKALSNEAEIPVIVMNNPQELNQILTAVEARYKRTGLKTAILAQGFDKYFPEGNQNNVQANAFQNALRGIKSKGALFIATTPDKSLISCDFMQSGIIDKVLEVTKPDEADRTEFFKRHFEGKEVFKDLNNDESISKIVELTITLSFADMVRVLDETARTAIADGKNANIEIFEEQLKDFSKETGLTPITEENRTARFDQHIKRIPIEEGEIMHLDDLGGIPKIKQRLRELYVDSLSDIENMKKAGFKNPIPDGAIFYGPPGNGKSTVARVLARELGLPYYEINLSDIGRDSLVGQASRDFKDKVQDLKRKYHEDEKHERSVLFLDEFDSIGVARSGNQSSYNTELTDALLQELNNPSKDGIILIAATNNIQDIDPALKRRGRIGNPIEFKNPDFDERKDIIKKELLKVDITKEFADNQELILYTAKELDGFSTSTIVNVVNDAAKDYYKNRTNFESSIKKAIDINLDKELSDFCGKAKLEQFKYDPLAYESLDQLKGMRTIIKQLREKVENAWDPEVRKVLLSLRRMPSGGFILEGPPGGGKTTIIETLAREMDVPLFKMNYNQKGNEFIYQFPKNLEAIFEHLALVAKIKKKPVMLFFDEAERFFPLHALGHKEEEVSQYKDLMNSAAAMGIILAGATNHIDRINQEVIGNPRRMGTIIHCGEPDDQDRSELLLGFFNDPSLSLDENVTSSELAELVALTNGFSIGDIVGTVDKAINKIVMEKEKFTTQKFLQEFKTNIVPKHICR